MTKEPIFNTINQVFKRNKIALFFFWLLIWLYFLAIFADFIAPYPADSEFRANSYAPPSTIHFFDQEGNFYLRPFIYPQKFTFDQYKNRVYVEDTKIKGVLRFFYRGESHYLLGFIPTTTNLFGFDLPAEQGRYYLLGADSRGRDIFSRILYGSRISLSIGLLGTFLTFLIGVSLGSIAGYFGGKIDSIIMRICEVLMLIPAIYLLFALRAIFPLDLSSAQIYLLIIFILSFISWASLARVMRGLVLSLREKEYVLASKALGQSSFKIILKHIIPNTYSYLLVALTLSIPSYILSESTLSFLGLGIQDPNVSWGYMLAEAAKISELKFHPWILWPGVFITITVLSYNLLGNSLRDAVDPTT
jgi:peptide/nickel transport system permease protein